MPKKKLVWEKKGRDSWLTQKPWETVSLGQLWNPIVQRHKIKYRLLAIIGSYDKHFVYSQIPTFTAPRIHTRNKNQPFLRKREFSNSQVWYFQIIQGIWCTEPILWFILSPETFVFSSIINSLWISNNDCFSRLTIKYFDTLHALQRT